jgi:intron-binding protein aquarius
MLTPPDIILSLTRTSRVGYLRDIRRLTVALSRARLGLYILGRREVFESCFELRQAFELLLKRPDKLTLVTGELYPSERTLADEVDKEVPGEAVMENVEHIGQYVYEMTNTRLQQLRQERGLLEAAPVVEEVVEEVEEVEELEDEGDEEDAEEGVRAEGFEAEEK